MKRCAFLLVVIILFGGCIKSARPVENVDNNISMEYLDTELSIEIRALSLLRQMTLEQKAGQMVQGARESVITERENLAGLGSVLSGGGSTPPDNTPLGWSALISLIQKRTMNTPLAIPSIYGLDAVHGHSNVVNSTIFPHNIGLGAANDTALMEAMGEVVAKEVLKTRVPWNFGPCVALSEDPRWGRSYESFSTDPEITAELGAAYVRGYQNAGGVATAKHYLGDGRTEWGTGMKGGIDRGDMKADMKDILSKDLVPYKRLIDEGVLTVMSSFSSVNGVKMHGHKELLTDVLKDDLGFDGFIISDWEALHELPQNTYNEKVWASVNAGCDMLMEPYRWREARSAIIKGAEQGEISIDRIDDAVLRILRVKLKAGLFEDPLLEERAASLPPLRDPASLDIARQLVEKSLVLLKNENNILPIKKGTRVYLLGPGMDNIGLQCGGWTMTWQGRMDGNRPITEGTSIKQSLLQLSSELGFQLITDPEQASQADMVLLVLAEMPYAEMEGDSPSPGLVGGKAHFGNKSAMDRALELGLPTATVILAGRHLSIENELEEWDAAVMAYLPGTEGDGIGNVLTGQVPFSGKLAMPWYKNVEGKRKEDFRELFPLGYGLITE